ncbi:MAG: helix-turn-helix domain-containing protein [Planctomycetaceae bacterium]|nr:MAG: helix-turn-helix domain-containing protein [Planctomycetaceae bacterium]
MHNSPRIILLLEATRGFDRGLLSGVARYSALNGPWTFYRRPHGYLKSKPRLDLKELEAWKPDGGIAPVTQLDELSRLHVPLIGYDVNEYSGSVPCVLSEDFEAGRLAARHLLDLGHRHFAFCGYSGIRWSRERCQAFCELVERAGCSVAVYRPLGRRPMAWAKEEAHVRHWLETLPKPIGMLCANDDQAASILETCHGLGYGVPEDVSVIGVDDDQHVCELQNPPLSSVRMASEQAGYQAAALLERMMVGREQASGQRIMAHATGVTARQSTNVLMVRHADVRKAVRFIRENAGRPIRVSDIVKATSLSHRTLNDLFHAELGCSIMKQLTNVRIAYISRLLTETKMRIHEIATTVGYEDDRHFARYFKRTTGLTPQAYRRKHSPP